jgi:hypothetical protein
MVCRPEETNTMSVISTSPHWEELYDHLLDKARRVAEKNRKVLRALGPAPNEEFAEVDAVDYVSNLDDRSET